MVNVEEPADLLLRGGVVYTATAIDSRPQAVAVRAGRIVAVGTDAQLGALVGARTEVVDLRGRLLLPGFQDAHVHPVEGGMTRKQCDLHELDTGTEYLDAIGNYARLRPAGQWVLGGGWSMDAFPGGIPDKGPLDRVVGKRPVYLPNRDGHSAWVSSHALELAGITAQTLDPADGRIERDNDGVPTGVLHEGAQRLITRLLPKTTSQDMLDGLIEGQRYLHSLGVTAWQDAIVGGDTAEHHSLAAYQDLASRGQLTARVVGALWWDRQRGNEQIPELLDARNASHIGRFKATSVKVMLDGVCETRTAAMLTPYLDDHGQETADFGMSFVDANELRRHVTALDAAGFQVHFHAIGDRAVRDALDAIEAARVANGYTDTRPHIAHIQVVHPEDRARFAQLGAVANAQPLWACSEPQMTELTIPLLGPERAAWQYPFASLIHSGARLAGGSDWPVSTPDPIQEIHVAVNRSLPGSEDLDAFLPNQALTLPEAIQAFTTGSAYVNHLDNETGTIQVGKKADLVLLDRNLLEEPTEEIALARVVLTLVDGQPVFTGDDT
ncbi:amidohydrolase [Leekyejoonella antrihumi]|uniref:Amidohydrolase n=1 Tax=Leekyejoonella antrihumi TaxID=1660198 RepID=A0A563E2Z6_9MICO|nr:amidohydrolase [Leekyejoonella antrihumi]TWP36623.1 amidohydrolase [Leekyejoonella antrihumi]